MRRSLSMKLAAVMFGMALVAMLASATAAFFVLHGAAQRSAVETAAVGREAIGAALAREGEVLVRALEARAADAIVGGDFAQLKDACSELMESDDVIGARVVDAEGWLLGDGSNAPAGRRTLVSSFGSVRVGQHDGALVLVRRVRAGSQVVGHVELRLSLAAAQDAEDRLAAVLEQQEEVSRNQLLRASAGTLWVVSIFALVIAAWLGRRLTQPIRTLRDASAAIGSGDLDVQVEVRSEDEIGQLSRAFNVMAEELQQGREAARERDRMGRELEIASTLQRGLLPARPDHPGFQIAGQMHPADEVGGDFYDVLSSPEALWITVGDVSGHGLSAGLIMLLVQSAFATAFQLDPMQSAKHALDAINRVLHTTIHERLSDSQYVTALLLVHQGEGRFEIVGSHEWPLVYRAKSGRCERVEVVGPWLGVVREVASIPIVELTLEPGDALCLYSDGLTESANAQGELFDEARLERAFAAAAAAGNSPREICDSVLRQVDDFAQAQVDDRTVLVIRRGDG